VKEEKKEEKEKEEETYVMLYTATTAREERGGGGRTKKPVSRTEVKESQDQAFEQEQEMEDKEDEWALCVISIVDPPDRVLMGLLCFHSYHRQCVCAWRDRCKAEKITVSCPMCRDLMSERHFT